MKYKPRKGSFKSAGRAIDYNLHHGSLNVRARDGKPWFPEVQA